MDLTVAGFFTYLYWHLDWHRSDQLAASGRPTLPLGKRIEWMATYVALVASLLAMVWYLTPA